MSTEQCFIVSCVVVYYCDSPATFVNLLDNDCVSNLSERFGFFPTKL